MKKSFEYDQTKYDPNAPTRTEEFLTADGVKTLTTDANDGAVLIQDSVDGDSLNPVTAAAVATAIEQGGGGGGGVPDVADPLYVNPDDAVALRFGSGMRLEAGDFGQDDTLAVALSGTGGLAYDDMEENALAVQLDPDGAIENFIDGGQQVGLRVKVDGTSIDIDTNGRLKAVGGGSGTVSTSNFIFGDGSSDAPLYVGVDGSSVSGKTVIVKTYRRDRKTSGSNTYYMGCSPLVYDEATEVFHLDLNGVIGEWEGSYGSTANVLFYNHDDPTEYATCSMGIAATSGSAESYYKLGAWDTVTQKTVPGDLQYWTYVGSGTLTLDKLKTFWCCLHIAGSTDPGNQGSPAGTFCINMDNNPGYAANALTVTDSARVPAVTSGNTGKVLTVTGGSTFGWAAVPSATLSRNNVNMTLSSGKLTCGGMAGGKGWYIGTLRIGMGSAPVTGPVTGTPICIHGYTNGSYSSFCGTGSVINLEYRPVAEIQFIFYLGNGDTGIESLQILDSTGADVTATLATGVTSRLDYWKISTN